jgi:hypothetical protein
MEAALTAGDPPADDPPAADPPAGPPPVIDPAADGPVAQGSQGGSRQSPQPSIVEQLRVQMRDMQRELQVLRGSHGSMQVGPPGRTPNPTRVPFAPPADTAGDNAGESQLANRAKGHAQEFEGIDVDSSCLAPGDPGFDPLVPPEGPREVYWPKPGYVGNPKVTLGDLKYDKKLYDGKVDAIKWCRVFSDYITALGLPPEVWGPALFHSCTPKLQEWFMGMLGDFQASDVGYYWLTKLMVAGPFAASASQSMIRAQLMKCWVSRDFDEWQSTFLQLVGKAKGLDELSKVAYFQFAVPMQLRKKLMVDDKGRPYTELKTVMAVANGLWTKGPIGDALLNWSDPENASDWKAEWVKASKGVMPP